jgi:hypothetical protein
LGKFVILRAGKLRGVKGPELFLIIPVVVNVVAIIDERIQTTAFSAEEAVRAWSRLRKKTGRSAMASPNYAT